MFSYNATWFFRKYSIISITYQLFSSHLIVLLQALLHTKGFLNYDFSLILYSDDSLLQATTFSVSVEKRIDVYAEWASDALASFLAAHFNFNLQYDIEAASTVEFLQR